MLNFYYMHRIFHFWIFNKIWDLYNFLSWGWGSVYVCVYRKMGPGFQIGPQKSFEVQTPTSAHQRTIHWMPRTHQRTVHWMPSTHQRTIHRMMPVITQLWWMNLNWVNNNTFFLVWQKWYYFFKCWNFRKLLRSFFLLNFL